MNWKLGYEGFVCQYMVFGPRVTDYETDITDDDQFRLEARLREEIGKELDPASVLDSLPEIVVSDNNGFVDRSAFYSTLKKIDIQASTVLVADEDINATIRLWSYMAVSLIVNGEVAGTIECPVYKPIHYIDVDVNLTKGENELVLKCINLGVRDTRNIVGIQIISGAEHIEVTLPCKEVRDEIYCKLSYLNDIQVKGKYLSLGDGKVYVSYPEWSMDYENRPDNKEETASGDFKVPDDKELVMLRIKSDNTGMDYSIKRIIEFDDSVSSSYETDEQKKDDKRFLKKIAEIKSANRGEFGFSIMNILARRALGIEDKRDRERFLEDLDLVEKRVDCSDFLICGIIRYIKNYEVDAELQARIKEVFLNFRYWMNMEGSDGMCFWSENHSLMFYSCMMLIGEMYPDDMFDRAHMTGIQISSYGRRKVEDWLYDVEKYGFEEFLSATYLNVTFAALLNLVDFADMEISQRATRLCDRMLKDLSIHTFKRTMIAPMGRVYRGVIRPYKEGVQAIVHQIDKDAPVTRGEGWLSYLATSKYKFTEEMKKLMYDDVDSSYSSGNSLIKLKKTRDYCLTSVQSPRKDGFERWKNVRINSTNSVAKVDTHEYLKSANESFHGTTYFEPGTCGYQQHMWYAALSNEAVVFVNHPGAMSEDSGMRPGYWHGNGVMPALRQQENVLGAVYYIPEDQPVGFTHVFLPENKFDEVRKEDNWIFVRKDSGYLALWCSQKPESYSDRLVDCEFRIYSRCHAYTVICGSQNEYGDFDSFIAKTGKCDIRFDSNKKELKIDGSVFTRWYQSSDNTQII